jgi:uncharacterized protein (TIGR03792 family)
MVVEFLKVRVPPDRQAAYIAADATIWTATLAAQPGYLGKEIWRDLDSPHDLVLAIRWRELADWERVPKNELDATETRFRTAMGEAFEIVSCTRYEET